VIHFFRLIRSLNLLILLFTQYMVRLCLTEEGISKGWQHIQDVEMLALALATVCIAAAGYIINDYYDIKIDTINKPNRVIVGKHLSRRVAMFWNVAFNALALGLTWWYMKPVVWAVNFGSIFLLWLYSNQLKRQPLVGNIAIAILTAVSVAVVALQFPQNAYLVFVFAVFAFFITLVREIVKDMEDVRGDVSFGCKTLPIVWGIRRSKQVIYIFLAIFAVILLSTYLTFPTRFAFYLYVVELPLLAYFVYKLHYADTKRTFHFLSQLCKVIMLLGVLSMLLL
jgi:4-hydroxybenzoate polyprenyltransferase